MFQVSISLALLLSAPAAPTPTTAEKRTIVTEDAELLNSAFLDTNAKTLLEFLRRRSSTHIPKQTLDELVAALQSDDPGRHDKALRACVGYGESSIPLLSRISNTGSNKNRTERARRALEVVQGRNSLALVLAALRVLDVHRPPETTQVLLDYVPVAPDESIVENVVKLLAALDKSEKEPSPELVNGLSDSVPIRRIVAANVLAQRPGHEERFRPLLKDSKPSVRLRVALTLARHSHPEAIPALIDLLGELPRERRQEVEDFLEDLAGEWAVEAPAGDGRLERRIRRQLWLGWWNELSGDLLLSEFRRLTPSDDDYLALVDSAKLLGSPDAKKSDSALAKLEQGGLASLPLLLAQSRSANPIVRTKAEDCLSRLEKDHSGVPSVAIRILALRNPIGTVQTLLDYYPFSTDESQRLLIEENLQRLAQKDGEPSPELVKALSDPLPARRALAGIVLVRQANVGSIPKVRALLTDPNLNTRFRVARALARQGDRQAVSKLIELLSMTSLEDAYEIEDFLMILSDGNGPDTRSTEKEGSQKESQEAWATWWSRERSRVDFTLVRRGGRQPKRTLVVESYNSKTRTGRVLELDRHGKILWQIGGMQYPMYVEVIGRNRVLIAEQNSSRVTERDLKGKILKTFSLASPNYCKRLRNGNTFLASRQVIREVDKNGKVVFSKSIPNKSILSIRKARNGDIAYATYQGDYVRMDGRGKILKEFRVPFDTRIGVNGGQVLPNDRVLISQGNTKSVREYDANGKVRWQATVASPYNPTRLPNGTTLVITSSGTRVATVDRSGKTIETKDTPDFRAYRYIVE